MQAMTWAIVAAMILVPPGFLIRRVARQSKLNLSRMTGGK